ncbi:MAG: hypothetical protein AB1491_00145 [Thermodesulfobacteriota bacterium]
MSQEGEKPGMDTPGGRPVEPVNAEEEGSLGASLSALQERRIYTGHPADVAEETPPEEPEGPSEKASETPGAVPPDGGTPPPATPPEGGEELPPGWDFKPKYRDHRAAELGYKEAERMAHEKAEEAKKAREETEALRRELEELKAKPAAPEEKPPVPPQMTEEEQEAAIARGLQEISEIDPYDPDYYKKAAKIWKKVGVGAPLDEQTIAAIVDRRVEEKLKASPAAAPPPQPEPAGGQGEAETLAMQMASEAGLDMKPGSPDYLLFWGNARFAPNLPFKEQVNWTIKEARRMKEEIAGQTPPSPPTPKPAEVHQEHAVLERGGSGYRPPPKEGEKPETMGTLLEKQLERRVI